MMLGLTSVARDAEDDFLIRRTPCMAPEYMCRIKRSFFELFETRSMEEDIVARYEVGPAPCTSEYNCVTGG